MTSCCASFKSLTSIVLSPDSVEALTAKKKASTAEMSPRVAKIRKASNEQLMMYKSVREC